jgi:hypothetical protein
MPDQRDPEITRLLDLLPAESSPESFWQEFREQALPPNRRQERNPPRLRRVTLVAAVAACSLASLAAGTALGSTLLTDQSTPTSSPPTATQTSAQPNTISFQEAPGWNTIGSSIAIGSDQRQRNSWATNGPFAANDATTGWPTNTLKAMRPDQVVVWAALNTSVDTPDPYPTRQLPLSLTDGEFKSDHYGGQPAPNVSQVGPIYARINGGYVTAYVWFGSNQPSANARAAADRELGRLVIGAAPQS